MAGKVVKKVLPKVFNCPNCGGQLTVSALGSTTTVVCQHCQSILDATHPLPTLVQKYNSKEIFKPDIPLGTFGTLRGVKWKVIGYMVRMDQGSSFSWNEYLLFNPYVGFSWLVQSAGHFSLAKVIHTLPQSLSDSQVTLNGKTFELFNSGNAVVKYVAGEFYWRVKVQDVTAMIDYISPPFMLSREGNLSELNWALSEYVAASEIQKAFPEQGSYLGYSVGVGANQDNPFQNDRGVVFWTWFLSILVIAAFGLYFNISKPEKVIFTDSIAIPSGVQKTKVVSAPFDIPDGQGNINFELRSQLNNNWLYAGVELINEDTGDSFSFDDGVEYYSGNDSEGSWSEGSDRTDQVVSSVPGGRYHLEYDLQTDANQAKAGVKIKRHGSMVMNFVLALLLISLYPLIREIRRRNFEKNRWSNSDFNPYFSYSTAEDAYENN